MGHTFFRVLVELAPNTTLIVLIVRFVNTFISIHKYVPSLVKFREFFSLFSDIPHG